MDRTTRMIRKKRSKKDFKVVYISSPVKVKTCASKFKNLVQELTGRHSDISRFVEINDDNIDHVHDHKQYLSVVDLLPTAAAAADEIDYSTATNTTTSRASSESNNIYDQQNRQVMTSCYHHDDQMFDGLISPFFDVADVSTNENYYYISTF